MGLVERAKADLAIRLRRRWMVKGRTLRDFEQRKCVFVHVPKCAGVAVSESLFGHRAGGHLTYRDYERIFRRLYRVCDFDDYFTFAFVRNPWDRLHSAYKFLKAGGMLPADREFADRELSRFETFSDFVKSWVNEVSVMSRLHFQPQSHFLLDSNGESSLRFVGRFERLESDYESLRERLGFGGPLRERNRTVNRTNYVDEYDAESREIVGRVYREDVEKLGYEFD